MKQRLIKLTLFFLSFSLFSQTAREWFTAGQNAFLEEDYFSAIEAFKEAQEINPRYMEAILGEAESYFLMGDYSEALVLMEQARPLGRLDIGYQILEARISLGLGLVDQAEQLFSSILGSEPLNSRALLGQIEVLVLKGAYSTARDRLRLFLEDFPGDFRAHMMLLQILNEQRRDQEILDSLEQAMFLHSFEPRLHEFAAEYFMRTGNLDRAFIHASTFTTISSDLGKGLSLQSRVLLAQGRYQEALEQLGRAIVQLPRDASLLYLTAVAFELLGNKDQAIGLYRRAIRLEPIEEIYRLAFEHTLLTDFPAEDPMRDTAAQYHFDKANDWRLANRFLPAMRSYLRGLRLWPFSNENRLEYGKLLQIRGFTTSYLSALEFIHREYPDFDDQEFLDDLEIGRSLYEDRLPARWGLGAMESENPTDDPPFNIPSGTSVSEPAYNIGLFFLEDEMKIPFFRGEDVLKGYVEDEIAFPRRWYSQFFPTNVETKTQAFRQAKEAGLDFFLIFGMRLGDRDFQITAELFLADSGRSLTTFDVYRSGMDRVSLAIGDLVDEIDAFFPLMGRVVFREGNQLLINLGSRDRVEPEDVFWLVREAQARFTVGENFFRYEEPYFLGTLSITEVDDWVAEGEYTQEGFYDLLRPGDWVLSPREPELPESQGNILLPNDFQREILSIPNR